MQHSSVFMRSSTTASVLPVLRNDIILQKYKKGEAIREIALATQYDCSRASIRNALIILEKEGLIITADNGTKTVCGIDRKDIKNLYALREYIELTAVQQLFMEKDKDISHVLTIMNQFMTVNLSNIEEVLSLDTAFHRSVIVSSKNKAITQAWENISGIMQAVFSLNMTNSNEYVKWFIESFKERHTQLFTSLMLNEEESMRLFKQHIEDAREVSEKAVSKLWEEIES